MNMTSHVRRSRSALLALGLLPAAVSCIDARRQDVVGSASFISSRSAMSTDYTPAVTFDAAGTTPAAGRPAAPVASGAAGTLGVSAGHAAPVGPATAGMPPTAAVATAGRAGAPSRPEAGAPAVSAGAPAAGASPSGGQAGAPASPGEHMGMLTLDFTTVNQGGGYAPQNVGAVWIETASGTFIKTLEKWGNIRANHLTRWNAASGGWGSIFGGGNTADKMDAISRATLRTHGPHSLTWDMLDLTGKVVPDGSYNVLIEVTEDNFRAGASAAIPFEKGAAPQQVTPADMPPYSKLTLSYQP